ncbi:ATP-binding protein [Bifidobacterium miconisargentati]|uniref:ATP-binding protein n=1 Tax=Bifidobacterium miconisargentati TaxID=2834437 RepID=UPI001BDD59A1|nr:ATP-binding protein [Bifidobacterium miconisargentati]MBW3090945.1 ATP-binding protein [Bifidobacterium miconisargentati]
MGFVGRTEELKTLEYHASLGRFQMVVVYGRRRVGKTALIAHFCENRRTLWFTAKEQSAAANLREFSQAVLSFFREPNFPAGFTRWDDALNYIADKAKDSPADPFVLVLDELPYAAAAEPSLPSVLQIAIDHRFKDTNMLMVLCGSNEGFMESKVLGYKSPLYGRRNAQIRLKPFDLFEACALMPPDADWQTRIHYYAALGGTPYYLEQIDPDLTFSQNMQARCFSQNGILYEEPMMLLRQELREPALYSSILDAVGAGRTKPKEIAEYAGVDPNTVGSYLRTLEQLGIIERLVPFGEDPNRSRKGLWKIRDPFFAYWYRFVSPATALVDTGYGQAAAVSATSGEVFDTYVGQQFETMCTQWLLRQCREQRIDFLPTAFGKWWGNDPIAREQTDIDVVMIDSINHKVLLGECKWREHLNETEAIDRLKARSPLIRENGDRLYYLFTKRPASAATQAKAAADSTLTIIDAETMMGNSTQAI